MDFIYIKDELKNSRLLLIILGTLLVPVINSFDSLLAGLYKVFGLTIKNLLILSISFHGLIMIGLVSLLYWIISSSNEKNRQVKITLSLTTLKNWGLISFLILVAGAAVNIYFRGHGDETSDISKINTGSLTIFDLAYLTMTQTGLMIVRNILLFTIFFVIVFRKE